MCQNIYFFVNHPIQWVRLVGVIVAFDLYPNRITMTLDDSSGFTIEIFCKKDRTFITPRIDSSVGNHGVITLNKKPAQKDDEHVCITSEGKVNLESFHVGSVVKIKGGISEFRGEKQVTLERISLVRTTNDEAALWAENAAFHRDILTRPWIVSDHEQRSAKKKAAGLNRERKAKEERRRGGKEGEEQFQTKRQTEEDHSCQKRQRRAKISRKYTH
ncbi:MAG: hypothetical protein L6R40_005552 [Gallowayella cf. fulva]|nr:MAG: hypothetical protein L6R40_005552 [Xanthomendoza cf. fulva]